jgi:hypothetical protein
LAGDSTITKFSCIAFFDGFSEMRKPKHYT